jgi:hypothetical protein
LLLHHSLLLAAIPSEMGLIAVSVQASILAAALTVLLVLLVLVLVL